jgi:hypothetical protein
MIQAYLKLSLTVQSIESTNDEAAMATSYVPKRNDMHDCDDITE